jgi:hypothetical protein
MIRINVFPDDLYSLPGLETHVYGIPPFSEIIGVKAVTEHPCMDLVCLSFCTHIMEVFAQVLPSSEFDDVANPQRLCHVAGQEAKSNDKSKGEGQPLVSLCVIESLKEKVGCK